MGGWVTHRAGLDDVERKFLALQGLELLPLGFQPVASPYTDYAIPDPLSLELIFQILVS
jgi:hypothetical protein